MSRNYISHLRSLSKAAAKSEVTDLICAKRFELLDADDVNSAMATTNATDFDVDDVEVSDVNIEGNEAEAEFVFVVNGDQDPDKPWSGNKIKGSALAIVDDEAEVRFRDVEAELDFDE